MTAEEFELVTHLPKEVRALATRMGQVEKALKTNRTYVSEQVHKAAQRSTKEIKETIMSTTAQQEQARTEQERREDERIKDDVKEGFQEAVREPVQSAWDRTKDFAGHFVPKTRKELGQLTLGFVVGQFTGIRIGTSDWMRETLADAAADRLR